MRRMKKLAIAVLIALLVIFSTEAPRTLAAFAPDAGQRASKGAVLAPVQTEHTEPEKKVEPGKEGEPDEGTLKEPEKGTGADLDIETEPGKETERETKIETEAEPGKETEKETETESGKETGKETEKESGKEPHKEAELDEGASADKETTEGVQEEESAESDQEDNEQASMGQTSGEGMTLDSERAAETEPTEQADDEQKTVPAKKDAEEVAEAEPDWLAGGTGSMEDLTASHKLMITEQYIQRYEHYDLGTTTNCTFDAVMDDKESMQGLVCLSPMKSGYGLKDRYVDHVYEYTTPMLAKAFYYGVGPGSDLLDKIIEEIRGSREGIEEIRLIVTHVAASQVYAKLHEADASMGTAKTPYDLGFHQTKPQVRQLVNRFGNAIMGLSVPKSYHVYVAAVDDDRKQDAGYGFFNKSVPEEAQVKVKKSAANTEITSGNSLYSLDGAEYGIYTDENCSEEAGVLVTDAKGESSALTLPSGKTYYVKEKKAPLGYRKDERTYAVTLEESDREYIVDVSDVPVFATIPVSIEKKSRQEDNEKAASLAGTEFTICYYVGYHGTGDIPDHADRTWVIRTSDTPQGCTAKLQEQDLVSGTLFKNGESTVLPLGTITIRETKAAAGYQNDGEFGTGIDMYVGQIRIDEQSGQVQIVDVQGEAKTKDADGMTFEVLDTPIPEPPVPEIGTYATDAADGDKTIATSGQVTVIDNVRFKNFTQGRRYRFEGTLMDKASGRAAEAGGALITGTTTITAKSADGSADVGLLFDAGDLAEGEYVAFEEVYEIDETTGEERLVAEHKDLEDEAQTITRPDEPEKPGKPGKPNKPGKPSRSPRTGDSNPIYALVACIALSAAGIAVAAFCQKRKEKQSK